MHEKVNFRHYKKRTEASKEMKKSKIKRKTFERFSKTREKDREQEKRLRNVYSTLIRHKLTQKIKKR